ncbi:hypothetical protein D3C76_1867720 [compost metagenome]
MAGRHVTGNAFELPDVVAVAAEDDPLPIHLSTADYQGVAFGFWETSYVARLGIKRSPR